MELSPNSMVFNQNHTQNYQNDLYLPVPKLLEIIAKIISIITKKMICSVTGMKHWKNYCLRWANITKHKQLFVLEIWE